MTGNWSTSTKGLLSPSRNERKQFDSEKLKLQGMMRDCEKERAAFEHLTRMKERIEAEVAHLKEAITTQFVDKADLEAIRARYEIQVAEMRNKFESQLEMNKQLADINEQLGKQLHLVVRNPLTTLRETHENVNAIRALLKYAQTQGREGNEGSEPDESETQEVAG